MAYFYNSADLKLHLWLAVIGVDCVLCTEAIVVSCSLKNRLYSYGR